MVGVGAVKWMIVTFAARRHADESRASPNWRGTMRIDAAGRCWRVGAGLEQLGGEACHL